MAVLTPGRMVGLWVLLGAFLLVNLLVRLGLAAFNGDAAVWWPQRLVPTLVLGALFDTAAAFFGLLPFVWLYGLWPQARRGAPRAMAWLSAALLLPVSVLVVFVAFSEFTFWNEFASRFNFIAVDYLIYTNEVIGNIRESYNLPLLLSGVALLALLLWALCLRRLQRAWQGVRGTPLRGRLLSVLLWTLAPALGWVALDARMKEFSANAQINELAGNGYYDFWHAFWANEISYERFYRMLPQDKAAATLGSMMPAGEVAADPQRPFDREVRASGPEKRLNVVLISVESFSASFMGAFGNSANLTPAVDKLAREGLLFTRLYATGTRTVRGLEALTLSVPPTPGNSIVKRPDNANLFSLGSVFKSKGYEPLYIYGGYGYFDNMNAFFSGNGYTVIDRTALKPEQIHFENIWGVADEDLFSLALRELDARHAKGQPFFAHVMTTSNHRPFTYPEGRIDIPSKSGREGGVKYTDYAIGRFVDEARARPWFRDTVFVIVADHTHNGRGKQELPPPSYHIPLVIYAPAHVQPGRVDTVASQIDVAPTVLALLNFSYRSRFFGQDILGEGRTRQRALMANYQTVGYFESGRVVELKPNGRARVVDAATGKAAPDDALSAKLVDEAVAYYQLTAQAFKKGQLRVP